MRVCGGARLVRREAMGEPHAGERQYMGEQHKRADEAREKGSGIELIETLALYVLPAAVLHACGELIIRVGAGCMSVRRGARSLLLAGGFVFGVLVERGCPRAATQSEEKHRQA